MSERIRPALLTPLPWIAAALACAIACARPAAETTMGRQQSAVATVDKAGAESGMRRDVEFLASPDLEGRRAGSVDADVAAAWLGFQLRTLGLTPAGSGEKGGMVQAFALPPARQFDGKGAGEPRLSLTSEEGKSTGKAVKSPQAIATLASAPGSVRGRLVKLGMDLESDQDLWSSPEPKIAVATLTQLEPVASTPAESQAAPNPHALPPSLRSFAFVAKQRGAKGLVVAIDTPDLALAESGEGRDVGLPALYILSSALPPADSWHLTYELDGGVVAVPRETKNVLARVPASTPNAEIVVVGAHYDHLGIGGSGSLAPGSKDAHRGADDNASGTALVLELARRFSARRGTLHRELVFAFWGAEELGLLGSRHWVKNSTVPFDRVVANVNFDMVGRSRGRKLDVGGVTSAEGWKDLIDKANLELGSPLQVRTSSRLSGVGGSDHMSFQDVKRPALFFFTGLHEDYHKPSDTPEKLDYAAMASIADLAEAAILALDASPKIQWIEPPAPPPESGPQSRGAEAGLGARLGTIPDYGAEEGGVVLSGASPGSPAEKAGLKAKDIVKRVGPYKIGDVNDLTTALGRLKAGDVVEIEYVRDGEVKTVKVTLARRRG